MQEKHTERTLIILKPDALERGIVGEIVTRFERVGFKMIGMKLLVSEKDTAARHYTEELAQRRGEHVRRMMIDMITSGPIVALVLEGIDAVEVTRKMVGATEPKAAAPGTIRGDYTHMSFASADRKNIGIFNLIHASATPAEAETEIGVWFKPEELVEHTPAYTKLTLHE
ncbi:MAG: nucleoside-diphosphate kinase [Patescibacteria group bacterium]